ncbi:hypothetical protein O181_099396 [Austropuccinia psidii MF-1]|uniref:Uncharacterized protein n=1 Tax=Austropuccinia psidii MF-1 TaxID=1389203 RepID=A0A9Q3JDC9_9BASI|nr:hypothetical protein [Austropuccinia psidii MF-1]
MAEANQVQKVEGQLMTSKQLKKVILMLIILFYLHKELTLPQEASVDIYKGSHKAYNNALKYKEYQILADLWKNGMNSYLTVRKFLGHPNTCRFWIAAIDGEEKHDALDTRLEEKQPCTTQASAKNSPSGQKPQIQCETAATSSKQGQRKGNSHQILQPRLPDSKKSLRCHGKCVSDGQNNDEITKKRGGQI